MHPRNPQNQMVSTFSCQLEPFFIFGLWKFKTKGQKQEWIIKVWLITMRVIYAEKHEKQGRHATGVWMFVGWFSKMELWDAWVVFRGRDLCMCYEKYGGEMMQWFAEMLRREVRNSEVRKSNGCWCGFLIWSKYAPPHLYLCHIIHFLRVGTVFQMFT